MQGFITPNEVAKKWNITPRQVHRICTCLGAVQISRIWLIPENAEKPTKARAAKTEYPLQK